MRDRERCGEASPAAVIGRQGVKTTDSAAPAATTPAWSRAASATPWRTPTAAAWRRATIRPASRTAAVHRRCCARLAAVGPA
jgi:hypothetical protein